MSFIKTHFANGCKIRMKWKLKEFVVRNVREGGSLKSDDFVSNIPGVNYCLKIYPFENIGNSNHQVKIVLQPSMGKTSTINASFTVSVNSASKKVVFNQLIVNDSPESTIFCSRTDLLNPQKKYFVDGFLEIELDGTLKPQGGIKRKAEKSLSLAELLFENDSDKDIILVIDDQELKIHKWILCAKSPVFKAELNSGLKEAVEKRIEITDFCFETVKIATDFCYEQNISELVNEENASELLHFADKYNIKSLHDSIQALSIEKLSELNVCKFANLSISTNANELRECCICFLVNLSKQSIIIEGVKTLKDEITSEIGRRSFFSTSDY
uniref:BTB domain-containing protein n=1 Tax=Panagrolaimus superbus TaxID=310955 RepID=A0A914YG84_9BILA